jgi:flagellar biosynthesis/type III secretory pathway M-ring protein FliF/YscJ
MKTFVKSVKQLKKFNHLSKVQQLILLSVLAIFVSALLIGLLNTQKSSYQVLFGELSSEDLNDIATLLARQNILYKLNEPKGLILVPEDKVQVVREKLAKEGLPREQGSGYELFKKNYGFVSSQFMESARLKHALETELSRTISQFNNIRAARVHLAIPKKSAFLRVEAKPSASVFLDVPKELRLSTTLTSSIINLVSASVPELNPSNITIVDSSGILLSDINRADDFSTQEKDQSLAVKETSIVKSNKDMDEAFLYQSKLIPILVALTALFITVLTMLGLRLFFLNSRQKLNKKQESDMTYSEESESMRQPFSKATVLLPSAKALKENFSEEQVSVIKEIANNDPKVVADLVKSWVNSGDKQ